MNEQLCIITCHGFTGYPAEMEPIGKFLEDKGKDKGFIWKNLQLPGHGTTPEDLKTKKWEDWANYLLEEVDKCLQEFNNNVIMIGLSLGGALTLYALANRPNVKAGVCLATPITVVSWYQKILLRLPFIGYFLNRQMNKIDIFDSEAKKSHNSYPIVYPESIKELTKFIPLVKQNISNIQQPLLIVQSKKDQIVDWHNAQVIYDKVASPRKELFFVDQSSHVLTEDYDKEKIFAKSFEFITSLAD